MVGDALFFVLSYLEKDHGCVMTLAQFSLTANMNKPARFNLALLA